MKKIFFILIVVSLFCSFSVQALDPAKDTIVNLWVETGRLIYENNEVVLFQVSFSDPKGLNGQVCLLTSDGKINMCQILPTHIIGQTGAQAEFSFLERNPGKYKLQSKFLNNGKIVVSNEVEITINSAFGPFPVVNSTKTESAIIDGYEFSWRRTYIDGIWAKPMPIGEPHPVFKLAPKKANAVTWGSFKTKGDSK
ncbi:MAG: hypothetical protein Q7R99_03035 [bacterium]|nr:hypothetical protein [bacterium]